MLLLNSVQSLTVLTFCAQWMGLAALLFSDIFSPFSTSYSLIDNVWHFGGENVVYSTMSCDLLHTETKLQGVNIFTMLTSFSLCMIRIQLRNNLFDMSNMCDYGDGLKRLTTHIQWYRESPVCSYFSYSKILKPVTIFPYFECYYRRMNKSRPIYYKNKQTNNNKQKQKQKTAWLNKGQWVITHNKSNIHQNLIDTF